VHGYLLHHLLTESASRFPENVAFVHEQTAIGYADLEHQSSRLAGALAELGVRPGDRIALLFDKSVEAIVAIFGVLKAGAAYVPIDAGAPACRAHQIIRSCGVTHLVGAVSAAKAVLSAEEPDSPLRHALLAEGSTDGLEAPGTITLTSFTQALAAQSPEHPGARVTDGYPAYVLHTSGSTGVPRGVVINHVNALTFVDMARAFFDVGPADRLCSHAPLHFDLSVFDLFVAVKAGAAAVSFPKQLSIFPKKLAQSIEDQKVTIWNSVSSVLSMIAERGMMDRFAYEALRLCIFSGDVMPPKYLRELKRRLPRSRFFNVYGQTEANSSTYYEVTAIPDEDRWKIPIGRPFPNFDVFALGADGRPIEKAGQEGELYVRAGSVAMGYWGKPDQTAEKFVKDPLVPISSQNVYRTGDVVTLDDAGDFVFVGRTDHMIKRHGNRVELGEIELTLASLPGVKQAVVVTLPDPILGNRLIAYVAGDDLTKGAVVAHCRASIPSYMIPDEVEIREVLPGTSTGKVDRTALRAEARARFAE
jgi:amino acid adenylation domain-containing protein